MIRQIHWLLGLRSKTLQKQQQRKFALLTCEPFDALRVGTATIKSRS